MSMTQNEEFFPDPPGPGQTCEHCLHWARTVAPEDHVFINTGPNGFQWVPSSIVRGEAVKQGQLAHFNQLPHQKMAYCSFLPQWLTKAEKNWCGSWHPRNTLKS